MATSTKGMNFGTVVLGGPGAIAGTITSGKLFDNYRKKGLSIKEARKKAIRASTLIGLSNGVIAGGLSRSVTAGLIHGGLGSLFGYLGARKRIRGKLENEALDHYLKNKR